jgi:hypothetical protein
LTDVVGRLTSALEGRAALKIDRAFVAGQDETHQLVLEAMVSIGRGWD